MFHVASVCYKCFRSMLQMFYLNVSNVDLGVAHVAMTIYACFKCFIYFRHMSQMLHLDVSKVDLVLHMLL
jgi:dolichyl-phosphate-mannose--protein O-mannosyl transferase